MSKSDLTEVEIKKVLSTLSEHKAIANELLFSIEYRNEHFLEIEEITQVEGYVLVNFFLHDLHMLRLLDGAWVRAYLGIDDQYDAEVLEKKYGLQYVATFNIVEIGEKKVYA